jgi:hypothetical protein
VLCHADTAGPEAGRGLLVLRPEDLRLNGLERGTLTGTVADAIFLGASTHVLVDLPSGERVRVATDGTAGPARGAVVGVDVHDGRGVLVRDEAPAADVATEVGDGDPELAALSAELKEPATASFPTPP